MSPVDRLKAVAHEAPSRVAVDAPDRSWSYAELYAASERMARRLWPLGAQPHETVALVAHPDDLAVQALHAVPRTGAAMAPLNPALGQSAIEEALNALGPSVIVTSGTAADEAGLPPSWVTRLDELPAADPDLPGLDDAPGYRLWTSGTSGKPKIVDVPLACLEASAEAVTKRLDLIDSDRWYASLSPAHIGGLALVLRATHVGCTLVSAGRFDLDVFDEGVEAGRITHASLVPTQLLRWMDRRGDRPPPPGLRCLLVGGAATSSEVLDRALQAGLPVALTYGLSEATSQVATAPPDLVREAPGTVGFPLDGLEVRLASDGEIQVRGTTVTPNSADEEGWLHTGDLAEFDGHGRLWVTGRKSARIISGGTNVDPRRVEERLLAIDGVGQAAVVGLDDPEWGEVVGALVVPAPGRSLDPEALAGLLPDHFGKADRPRQVRVVEELPLNANGKVDPAAVRAALTDG